jgi:hypothetical protein
MLSMFVIGLFAIRPDKKSAPEIRKVRKIGMIAGGSGIENCFSISLKMHLLILFVWLLH